MENNSEHPFADAGLHEFVDLDLIVTAMDTPAKEKVLSDALKDLPAARKLSIAKSKISLQ